MRTREKLDRIIIFGVFDRLHSGHRSFLKQAKRHGKELIVVVARDSAVQRLKNHKPAQNEKIRLHNAGRLKEVFQVVLGDRQEGKYRVIKKYKPDIICLGYDQKWLGDDLRKRMRDGKIPKIRLVRLRAFMPNKYHSSLL